MFINAGYAYTDAQYKILTRPVRATPMLVTEFVMPRSIYLISGPSMIYLLEIWRGWVLDCMNHVSKNFTQSNNAYVLPAYTLVDAVVSYRFRQLQLQLNINNLLDKTHFTDAIFGNQFFPGKRVVSSNSYNSEI